MSLPAGTPIGKYVVRKKIAEGGMAEIFLCQSHGPAGFEKEVVIKRIHSHYASDPEFVQMFINEAHLASKLNHANVVQIFDFDKHEDTYYLAMEYVRGQSLWELRRKCRERMISMSPALAAHVGSEVARGLHYVHRLTDKGSPLGLVHRDVTPHNVLLSFDGAVKLTDFGIAKAGNRHTAPGMIKGKFAYMSPEQAQGEDVDARTDVFALGIVLWEMLTGGRLFDADSDLGTLRAVQTSKIAPPERINPDIPRELSDAVMQALERKLPDRMQSAQELERALRQFLLRHASQLEDTDVSGFMRRVFPEDASFRTAADVDGPTESATADPGLKNRQTALLRSGRAAARIEESASAALPLVEEVSEDFAHGPTWVLGKPNVENPAPLRPPPFRSKSVRSWLVAAAAAALASGAAVVVTHKRANLAVQFSEPLATVILPMAALSPDGDEVSAWTEDSAPEAPEPCVCGPFAACAEGFEERSLRKPILKSEKGTLRLVVTPWAKLFVDGKEKGEVSRSKAIPMSSGSHNLKLVHPKGIVERKVTIVSGEVVQLSVNILE